MSLITKLSKILFDLSNKNITLCLVHTRAINNELRKVIGVRDGADLDF
jgi:hypothetical protein